MDAQLTPEEVEGLTGQDAENLRNEEHPEEGMDEDMEGTGVDEPVITSAAWDDEMDAEDKEEFLIAKINFDELTEDDRNIYLEMSALRNEIKEGSAEEEGKEDVKNLIRRCGELKADILDGSRVRFFDLMINKLTELK